MKALALLVSLLALSSSHPQQAKPPENPFGPPVRLGDYQFRITGASFATRFVTAEQTYVPEKGYKYLVLNYTVQNAGKQDLHYYWANLLMTVVGADTDNYEFEQAVFNPEKLTPLSLDIKPTQTVPVVALIKVPNSDPIHKLMVKNEGNVQRFDLRGKVKKHTGIFATPDGVTVLDEGAGKLGEKLEAGIFDITIDKISETSGPIGDHSVEDGQKFVVANVTFTNASKQSQYLYWSVVQFEIQDTNDEPINWLQVLLRGTGNSDLGQDVKPGQSVTGRALFTADQDAKPKRLIITLESGRTISVPLS